MTAHVWCRLSATFWLIRRARHVEGPDHPALPEVLDARMRAQRMESDAQVVLEGEWLDLHGVVAAPVILSLDGWEHVYPLELAADEVTAMKRAVDAIASANAAIV